MTKGWRKKVLAKLRKWFWPQTLPPEGANCPLCGARTVQYKRHLQRGMILALMTIRELSVQANNGDPKGWVGVGKKHGMSSWLALWLHHREYSKLAWWGLLENMPTVGNNHDLDAGKWRVTDEGISFLQRQTLARAYFRVVHNKVYRRSKRMVTVDEAFGETFDYHAMVAATLKPWQWALKPPKTLTS